MLWEFKHFMVTIPRIVFLSQILKELVTKGRKSSSKHTTTKSTSTKTTPKKATSTSTKKTTTLPLHFMCDEEYDAVFTNAKNDLFVLHDYENLWKFDMKNKSWIKEDLWSTYRGIEDGVRGGLVDKNKVTWFFKGKQSNI